MTVVGEQQDPYCKVAEMQPRQKWRGELSDHLGPKLETSNYSISSIP